MYTDINVKSMFARFVKSRMLFLASARVQMRAVCFGRAADNDSEMGVKQAGSLAHLIS